MQKNKSKTTILKTAGNIIRDHGIDGLTMRRLARESGVSLTTPYNLFGSKSRILSILLDSSVESKLSEVFHTRPEDPFDYIFSFFRLAIEVFGEDPEFYRHVFRGLLLSGHTISTPAIIRRSVEVWEKGIGQAQEDGLLQQGACRDLLAHQLHIHYLGVLTLWIENTVDMEGLLWHVLYGACLYLMAVATGKGKKRLTPLMKDIEKNFERKGEVFTYTRQP